MRKIFLATGLLLALGACAAPTPTVTPTAAPSILVAPSSPTIANTPQATIGGRTANLKEIVNTVQTRGAADKNFESANVGLTLNVGGQARTGENSKARLDFVEGTIVRLGPTTILTVEELANTNGSPLTRFQLELGKLWIALQGGTFDVKTPAGIVSVRGSYGMIEVFSDGTVRVVDLEGIFVHVPTNTRLSNMKGLVLGKDTKIISDFAVPETFLIDFCDNNQESCPTLLKLLGIKSIEPLRDPNEKREPGKENPKCRPTRLGGC